MSCLARLHLNVSDSKHGDGGVRVVDSCGSFVKKSRTRVLPHISYQGMAFLVSYLVLHLLHCTLAEIDLYLVVIRFVLIDYRSCKSGRSHGSYGRRVNTKRL